jgi:hypothetical protein
MIDPNAAWNDALKLRSYELDAGTSQSQVLYFISTTDGFKAPKSNKGGEERPDNQKTASAYCYNHKGCAELSLTGFCCPAPNGSNLGCCDSFDVVSETKSTDGEEATHNQESAPQSPETASASCSENEVCAALNLTGLCCPAPGGANLGCCDSFDVSNTKTTDGEEVPHNQESAPQSPETASVSCSEHEGCAALNLTGLCCPAPGGANLGCCDV